MSRIITAILLYCTGSAIAAPVTSITQHNITWTFDRAYEAGQYCTGDWWVVGPITLTGITTDRHTEGFTPGLHDDGSMINPGTNGRQGYAGNLGSYDSTLNAGIPNGAKVSGANPLTLPVNSSLVSMTSWLYVNSDSTETGCPGFNGGTHTPRPATRDAAVLTCVSSAPPAGSFRPSYCGTDKTPRFNLTDLDKSVLLNLDPPASVPALADLEDRMERPWIDHVNQYSGAFVHPSENMPEYGQSVSQAIGKAACMLHLDFSQLPGSPSKDTLLMRFVQLGIDLHGIIANGGSYPANGGHLMGRKYPIMFAGLALDDSAMATVGFSDAVFQEDKNTFYVDQAAVDMTHSTSWKPDTRAPGLAYETANIGIPEWGIRHDPDSYADNFHWSATYRTINNNAFAGFVLAIHLCDADTLWNHPVILDYMDRVAAFGSAGYPPGAKNYEYYTFGSTFIHDLWMANRYDYGCTWVADEDTVYSNGSVDCSRCLRNCPDTASTVSRGSGTDTPAPLRFANPAGNTLQVLINASGSPDEVCLFDASGTCIVPVTVSGTGYTFDFSMLPDGVYYLSTGDGQIQRVVHTQ